MTVQMAKNLIDKIFVWFYKMVTRKLNIRKTTKQNTFSEGSSFSYTLLSKAALQEKINKMNPFFNNDS